MRGSLVILILAGVFLFSLAGVYALPENVFQNATGSFVYNCTNLNESGVYTLNQSVSATGSCFNITADNVTLKAVGASVVYYGEGGSTSYGVYVQGRKNISMEFLIIETNSTTSTNYAIWMSNTNSSFILNSAITKSGVGGAGIYLLNDRLITLESNSFVINDGELATTDAVSLENTHYSNITSNIVSSFNPSKPSDHYGGFKSVNSNYNRYVSNNVLSSNSEGFIFNNGGDYNYFYNNTVSSNLFAFESLDLDNSTFIGNTFSSSGFGCFEVSGNGNIITNNHASSLSSYGLINVGVDNYFYNNEFYGSTEGAKIISQNSSFINNIFYCSGCTGIWVLGGTSLSIIQNLFSGNTIGGTVGMNFTDTDQISMRGISDLTNTLINNDISADTYGIVFDDDQFDMLLVNNIINSGVGYRSLSLPSTSENNTLLFNNSYGSIKFVRNSFNITSDLLWNTDIKILNNSAFLNSTAVPGLNISANVTFYNLPRNVVSANILKDGVACIDCYNFTSLNAGTVVFNVSSWSNYTINYTLDEVNPVVNLFSIADSTSISRVIIFNVSDDSDIANCSVYLNSALSSSNSSVINKSSNNSISLSGLGVGSYNVSVSCTDEWSLVGNSSNVTFVVSAVVEESSSGGDSGAMTLNVPSASLVNGFSRNLGRGDGFRFNLSGQMHNLTLNSFNNSTANITIRSTPQNFLVKINESILVDVNSDGIKDLEVSYKKYFTSVAEIKIKSVFIQTNNTIVNNTVVGESTDVDFTIEKEFSIWKIILAVLILVIAFIVYLILRKRNN